MDSHAILRDTQSRLHALTIDEIFEQGLHEFIAEFLAHNQKLARQVQSDYRFYE